MSAAAPPAPTTDSLRGIRQASGLSRHAVAKLIELGFVDPAREPGGGWRFSFQDLVLLRSAHELRAAGIPTRQILRSLRRLKGSLPLEAPMSGLRITAVGDRIAVRAGGSQWEPDTGQLVMDFSVSPGAGASGFGSVSRLSKPVPIKDGGASVDVDAIFAQAEDLEETDAAAAEAAYRQVLALDPAHAHAYLNLGFMMCEAGRCGEAVLLLDDAVLHCPDDPLVHYNRGVALEGLDRVAEALESYEQCLRLQPDIADAHQNAALLYAREGQQQLAIRHFSAYRRLTAKA
ncbi:tetratricopeptide repeat protein [Variovorax rhizosphaerae]|uniref:Tetratricopeptide repeat protein n=1 Tax=Variovorax rhizosphaerae TaxID=1836200 RepID=A0ABU8WKG5_9BURK